MKSGKHLLSVRKRMYESLSDKVVEIFDSETHREQVKLSESFGTLTIDSSPSGAKILIDNEKVDTTPVRSYRLSPGKYELKIEKEGYTGKQYKITVVKGKAITLSLAQATLQKKVFTIQVFADPPEPDALVYLDGKEMGKAPLTLNDLDVGTYTVEIRTEGKIGKTEIRGEEGENKMVVVKLEKGGIGGITGMVLIKSGCFKMGDSSDGFLWFSDGASDERPVHEVCVDDYYMSDHEVTQGEWKAVMGSNPSHFSNCGDDCPVEKVSWRNVQDYIKKLNRKEGQKYRLPTEAEWEYAARSGGKKEKWSGTSSESSLGTYAWYKSNSGGRTHPVKTKSPNGLGLYDMSGNVWEWVSDWYGDDYYKASPRMNPQGPSSGFYRSVRGGSWGNDPSYLRASNREVNLLVHRASVLGFRLAMTY